MLLVTACSSGASRSDAVDREPACQTAEHLSATPVPVRIVARSVGRDSTSGFTRFGQCQIGAEIEPDEARGVWSIADEATMAASIRWCLETARARKVELLILPEFVLSLPAATRETLIGEMQAYARAQRAIVIGGSYYDEERHNRMVVVGPDWIEYGYKIRPSRYETSPRAGMGMTPGQRILVMDTDLGSFALITCVDLLSDDIQYTVRSLINDGKLDVLLNVNMNSASWEFLIEVNSLVRRHPVAASITNSTFDSCGDAADNGRCGGHTALATDLRTADYDWPNNDADLLPLLPAPILETNADGEPQRALPYSNIVADLGHASDGMLIYDLNMRSQRVPRSTGAPDLGYPPVKNLEIVRRP